MKRFKNISLIYECDRPTLLRAAMLAKDNRARLTIIYPIKESSSYGHLTVGHTRIDVRKIAHQLAQTRLKEAANAIKSLGVRTTARLLVGEPFMEIIRDVVEHRRDLVIMTAEGKGGLRERLFGSTSMHLMRKCPAPVLIMKPGRQQRFRRILAAVDPELTGGARDTLNRTILELASSVSAKDNADLHVAHAWALFGESLLRGRGGINARLLDIEIVKEAGKRRELVEKLLAKHSVVDSRLHVIKGDAASVISHLVKKLRIDLLVMGTVCRTGIPGFIIGNTAERVLDCVDCSVLTVKPDGFVSPVAPLLSVKER
jgi:universal stress protein E